MRDFVKDHHEMVKEETQYWLNHQPISIQEKYEYAEYLYLILNYKEAVKIFEEIAEKNAMASFSLGYCLFKGIGTESDEEKAQACFKRFVSEIQENELCEERTYRLAMCYNYGWGLSQDKAKALNLFESIEDGHGGAAYELALIYQGDINNNAQMYNSAASYFIKAHELLQDDSLLAYYKMDGSRGEAFEYFSEIKTYYSYLIGRHALAVRDQPCADSYQRLSQIYEDGFPGDGKDGLENFKNKAKNFAQKALDFC